MEGIIWSFISLIIFLIIIAAPIILIVLLVVKLLNKKEKKRVEPYIPPNIQHQQQRYNPPQQQYAPAPTQPIKQPIVQPQIPVETYPYEKQFLLTKNEWAFYKELKKITDKYNLHILSKIRLADIVRVKKGLSNSEYMSAFSKIKSKHLDFVLANPENLAILCVIELDDSSHDKVNSQQNDYFKNKVLETVNIPLIRLQNTVALEFKICEAVKIPLRA